MIHSLLKEVELGTPEEQANKILTTKEIREFLDELFTKSLRYLFMPIPIDCIDCSKYLDNKE